MTEDDALQRLRRLHDAGLIDGDEYDRFVPLVEEDERHRSVAGVTSPRDPRSEAGAAPRLYDASDPTIAVRRRWLLIAGSVAALLMAAVVMVLAR